MPLSVDRLDKYREEFTMKFHYRMLVAGNVIPSFSQIDNAANRAYDFWDVKIGDIPNQTIRMREIAMDRIAAEFPVGTPAAVTRWLFGSVTMERINSGA